MLLVNYSNSGNLDLQVKLKYEKIEIRQITSEIREIMLLVQNGIILIAFVVKYCCLIFTPILV